jgi:hypothetical protein
VIISNPICCYLAVFLVAREFTLIAMARPAADADGTRKTSIVSR